MIELSDPVLTDAPNFDPERVWSRYEDGTLGAHTAVAVLGRRLVELAAERRAIEQAEQVYRERIAAALDALGQPVRVRGLATYELAPAATVASYDRRALDDLVRRLLESGEIHTARAIQAARKETTRAGGLRVVREKEGDHGAHA